MTTNKTVRIPQQERSIEKRKRILDAAIAEFSANGFEKTNAKAIAREAGVSIGTFYAYFSDKKNVLMEILGQHLLDVDQSVFGQMEQTIKTGASGREIMRAAVRLGHATHTQPPGFLRMMLAMRYYDEDVSTMVEAEHAPLLRRLTNLLEMLAPRLRVTDLEAAALITSAAFDEILHSCIVFDPPIEQERIFESLADMAATFLFTDPDARG